MLASMLRSIFPRPEGQSADRGHSISKEDSASPSAATDAVRMGLRSAESSQAESHVSPGANPWADMDSNTSSTVADPWANYRPSRLYQSERAEDSWRRCAPPQSSSCQATSAGWTATRSRDANCLKVDDFAPVWDSNEEGAGMSWLPEAESRHSSARHWREGMWNDNGWQWWESHREPAKYDWWQDSSSWDAHWWSTNGRREQDDHWLGREEWGSGAWRTSRRSWDSDDDEAVRGQGRLHMCKNASSSTLGADEACSPSPPMYTCLKDAEQFIPVVDPWGTDAGTLISSLSNCGVVFITARAPTDSFQVALDSAKYAGWLRVLYEARWNPASFYKRECVRGGHLRLSVNEDLQRTVEGKDKDYSPDERSNFGISDSAVNNQRSGFVDWRDLQWVIDDYVALKGVLVDIVERELESWCAGENGSPKSLGVRLRHGRESWAQSRLRHCLYPPGGTCTEHTDYGVVTLQLCNYSGFEGFIHGFYSRATCSSASPTDISVHFGTV
eukprot:gnl/TRDRNA2_/TRDRNA2_85153_c0_seq1.p1 gnl/TRDRNA2_/TRDRNA2_85153_c0~~gnl/TRDRNA2_/TRDRNA2_85153_c0_seq1.p1  ORF type:complete len:501 (+),score=55.48 gnl/TRDRNA2_/TRDRNA2_85153_c0_seq1:123-1625(+)